MTDDLRQLAALHPTAAAWLAALAGAAAAAIAALVVLHLLALALARAVRGRPWAGAVLAAARRPARVAVVLLALVWDATPDDLPRVATVTRFTTLALTVALTWLGARCVAGLSGAIIAAHPIAVADNLQARRVHTQVRIVGRVAVGLVVFLGAVLALMTFPSIRAIGASLLASAGVAGLVVGLAARPALANLVAGVQLALAQPIRLDDVVVIEGEWGRVEDIRTTDVVIRLWDERRLVVPLQWFLEHPFQNWTHTSAQIVGTVFVWADYRAPLAPLRNELERLCREAPEWDGRVCVLQVTDATEHAIQLRALVSSCDSGRNFDLRCHVRAGLVAFLRDRHPECLPHARVEIERPRAAS